MVGSTQGSKVWITAEQIIFRIDLVLNEPRHKKTCRLCWSDCVDAQADLLLCCSHMAKTGFLILVLWDQR